MESNHSQPTQHQRNLRRILFVVGSQPPEACGVGGYVQRLSAELNSLSAKTGVLSEILHEGPWHLGAVPKIFQKLKAFTRRQMPVARIPEDGVSIVHFQYPSVGFGRSLAAPVLAFMAVLSGMNVVTTLHEFSQVHVLRRLTGLLFVLISHRVIVSNDYERQAIGRFWPNLKTKITVIPVGSSILKGSREKKNEIGRITYFGLLRPEKGIEKFIEVAVLARQKAVKLSFQIIGARDKRLFQYAEQLMTAAQSADLEWVLDRSESEVAELLAEVNYAYFPFPDGASDRRTSLLAALVNGAAVLTTADKFTPEKMRSSLQPLSVNHTAEVALQRIVEETADLNGLRARQTEARDLAKEYSWDRLIERHRKVYESLC